MTYKPWTLSKLLGEKNRSLFLPHIQRPFVWEWDQVVRFLDSLMKNYPIQTFLFWRTRDPIKARKFMDNIEEDPDLSRYYDAKMSESGQEKTLVLDGQQRLQSLFSAFDGSFYSRDIYLDITSGAVEIEDGRTYNFELPDNPLPLPYVKIRNVTSDKRNAEEIADELNEQLSILLSNETAGDRTVREKRVRRSVAQLVSILREEKHLWIEELDGVASNAYPYETVLNIFIRVNSGGTKLDAADLVFAAMKEAWTDVEENVESVVTNLNQSGKISFDKNFALKGMMLASGKGATLAPQSFLGPKGDALLKDLENNWSRADGAFAQLRDFVYNDLMIYSDMMVRSYNAFLPIFEYFYLHPTPSPENKELLRSYYYRSQMFNWYSRGTDALAESMHGILAKNTGKDFPLADIKQYFSGLGKDIDLQKWHLLVPRIRLILLNLLYTNQMGHSAFNVAYRRNEPHVDHIYPKSKMKSLASGEVNHIGNYRFIGAGENLRKRAEDPSTYFARLKSGGVDISRHLMVKKYSDDPDLLVPVNYQSFRDERFNMIYETCSKVVNR